VANFQNSLLNMKYLESLGPVDLCGAPEKPHGVSVEAFTFLSLLFSITRPQAMHLVTCTDGYSSEQL